jgi:hypothetical protein
MESLLRRWKDVNVFTTPFPHIVVHQPVSAELARALLAQYPTIGQITRDKDRGSNKRFSYSACQAMMDGVISPLWLDFVARHISPAFLGEVLGLFGPYLASLYPKLLRKPGGLTALRAGLRYFDTFENADVLLDAQICVNTPVLSDASSVREPHVDMPNKLFAGLFYLRSPEDRSSGGDLELYAFKQSPGGFSGMYVDKEQLERVKTIAYQDNVLVMFINVPTAVHGVSPRLPTATPRLLFNLLGEVRKPLFDLGPYQINHDLKREPFSY